ncbi:hypothetical protein HK101_008084 [Irineochytrium annulatum]|nr:hypothetical protein HK101_008084 [Irineochytrium annulatum]
MGDDGRGFNPENHLKHASNEELYRIMQSLKSAGVSVPPSGQEYFQPNGPEYNDMDMNGYRMDARRQSVNIPVFPDSNTGSPRDFFTIDRRGSLGSLPRTLGLTYLNDRDDMADQRQSSQARPNMYGHLTMNDGAPSPPRLPDHSYKLAEPDFTFSDENGVPMKPSRSQQSMEGSPSQQIPTPPASDQRLRLEVETTLHKTLELECVLTLKELKSFEAQAAAAEVEYARALQAFREAEMIKEERRRELDSALAERSEAKSIIRYLTGRVESLNTRIRDGSGRLNVLRTGHRGSSSGLPGGVGENRFFAPTSESPTQRSSSSGKTVGGLVSASAGASLMPPNSLISARRHSSPGLTSIAPEATSIVSSIDRDLDEWDRRSERNDSSAQDGADEERYRTESQETLINQKRARTTSPADGDEGMQQSQQQHLHQLKSSHLSINTAVTSGGAAAAAPSSAVSHPGETLSLLSHHTDMDSGGGAGGNGQPSSCISYQRGQCPLTTRECKGLHVCIRCNGPHPVILCKKDRNVCVKWNMEAWNSAGTCRIVDCRRLHECIRCGTSHPSIICPENLDNYLIEYIKRRRSENCPDEELHRLELELSHSLPTTNTPSTAASAAAAAAAMSMSLAGMPQNPMQHYGLPQHMMHPNMMNLASMNMGMVPQPHPMHVAAAAAAAASLRGPGGNGGLTSPNQGRGEMSPPAVSNKLLMSALDIERSSKRMRGEEMGGMLMPIRGAQGGGQGGGGGSLSNGGMSLLTEGERKSICRDYNNFKCEIDVASVTFA